MVRTGQLPDTLLAIAGRFITTGVKLDEAPAEDRLRFVELTRAMIAAMVRAVQAPDGAWEDVALTPADLDELELPQDDLRMLELVATRQATPAIATASSRAMIAQRAMAERLTEADLDREPDDVDSAVAAAAAGEADATVNGWATFRGEPAGAVDRADGGAVRTEPVAGLPGAG